MADLTTGKKPVYAGRNEIGQRRRPRRLSRAEIANLVSTIESAINAERDEVRVFWTGDHGKHIHAAPLSLGEKARIG